MGRVILQEVCVCVIFSVLFLKTQNIIRFILFYLKHEELDFIFHGVGLVGVQSI